ncbi:IS5/IS1182 family transposase, partial [Photobacterium indicum]
MPYKYNNAKRHHFKKHTYALNNYREYNQALKQRGRFDIWISDDIIKHWQHDDRVYDGTGSSVKYPDSNKVNAKRSWRKAHFAVDEAHFIQSAVLTDKNTMDDQVVGTLC